MFNDSKLASLVKSNTNIAGLKDGDTYYIIIDGCFCVKMPCLPSYPKFMSKLYSTGKLLPDGELLNGNRDTVKKYFDADVSKMTITSYTHINVEVEDKGAVGIWNVQDLAYGAYKKCYTDAVDFTQGHSSAEGKPGTRLLYFVDNTNNIYAMVCPFRIDVADCIKRLLPSVYTEIQKGGTENGNMSEMR